MQRQADYVLGAPAQDACCGLVDEGRASLSIQAIDALAGRVQDQLMPCAQPPEFGGPVFGAGVRGGVSLVFEIVISAHGRLHKFTNICE